MVAGDTIPGGSSLDGAEADGARRAACPVGLGAIEAATAGDRITGDHALGSRRWDLKAGLAGAMPRSLESPLSACRRLTCMTSKIDYRSSGSRRCRQGPAQHNPTGPQV